MEAFSEMYIESDECKFEHVNSRAEEPIHFSELSKDLKSLVVIGQPFSTVTNILQLNNLEDLWLVDCEILNADEVTEFRQLRKLCIYSNVLNKVPSNLLHLRFLKILWLAGNNIKCISGCEFPPNLVELNLAANLIVTIKNCFKNCENLETLNLAGNPLLTIFDIYHVRRLKKLKNLLLYDPMYNYSGITRLCNYRSFVLNILSNLEQLDSFYVDDRELELTKVFYLNKHYYYAVIKMEAHFKYWICKEQYNYKIYEKLANIKQKYQALEYKIFMDAQKNEDLVSHINYEMKKKLDLELNVWEFDSRKEMSLMENLLNVKTTNLDMEMQFFGNIKFSTIPKNSYIYSIFQNVLNNFICPNIKKEHSVKGISIALVTMAINTRECLHEEAQFLLDITDGENFGEIYIFCEPFNVTNSYEQLYNEFRTAVLNQEQTEVQTKIITQCVYAADKSLSGKYPPNETVGITVTRILSLGFFRIPVSGRMKFNDTGDDSPHTCEVKTIMDAEYGSPVYLIEYTYLTETEDVLRNCDKIDFLGIFNSSSSLKLAAIESLPSSINVWCTLTRLVLSHQNLSSFGISETFNNIKKLDISHNKFVTISEVCDRFPNLEVLCASFNEISAPPSYFFKMEDLKDIDLSWNCINNLFPLLYWFHKSMPNITKLNLKYNIFMDLHQASHDVYLLSRFLKYLTEYNLVALIKYNIQSSDSVYVLDVLDKYFNIFELSEEHFEEKDLLKNVYWLEECCSAIKSDHIAVDSEGRIKCVNLKNSKPFISVVFKNATENISSLKITQNKLMEIEFLKNMPNIIEVDLSFNLISTIRESFISLSHIVKLNLRGNYISSLEDLREANLVFLKVLDVSKNHLKSIKGIENAINIEELYICSNKIDHLENYLFVKQFKELKVIDVRENSLQSIDILRKYLIFHLPHLQYINGTTILEIEIQEASQTFGGVLDMEYLQSQNKYKDFKSLQQISIHNCSIKRVSLPGEHFKCITSMNLENNSLMSIADLLPLENLKCLCLTRNNICKFGAASENMMFKHLEELYLNSNHIYKLGPLELHRMPKLKTLFLQDNELTSVKGIERIFNLEHLILDNNRINKIQIKYVKKLSNLKSLFIESNYIDSLEFIPFLKRIVKLYARNNRIQDIKVLSYLKYLTRIEEITFSGNPVCRNSDTYVKLLTYLPNINCVDGVRLETVANENIYYQ